jgi:OOP family OmpA-OmpF porin
MKKLLQFVSLIVLGVLATACAPKTIPAPFAPTDLNAKVTSGEYVKKVDNFIVLFDASSSMYLDRNWESKLDKAKLVANNMNNTIPNLDLQSGMRVFGPGKYCVADGCTLQYGMTAYSKSGLAEAIAAVTDANGRTPMSPAIDLSKSDLGLSKGDIAVIVIGDGLANVGGPVTAAAQALKDKYQDRVCIYTILIGDDPEGRATMEATSKIGGCGFSTDEAAVSTPDGMADFVEKVFLKKGAKCAEPKKCAPPAEKRCFTVELKVEFDFDKANIRTEYYKTLTDFGDFMRSYPEHTVNLEGHTDHIGSDAYNMKLAQRRAESVRTFLLKHFSNIDPARLTAIPYGESKPAASNDTNEGRQRNRRVFATFNYCEKEK